MSEIKRGLPPPQKTARTDARLSALVRAALDSPGEWLHIQTQQSPAYTSKQILDALGWDCEIRRIDANNSLLCVRCPVFWRVETKPDATRIESTRIESTRIEPERIASEQSGPERIASVQPAETPVRHEVIRPRENPVSKAARLQRESRRGELPPIS